MKRGEIGEQFVSAGRRIGSSGSGLDVFDYDILRQTGFEKGKKIERGISDVRRKHETDR
jgi:hypothetical protein